MWDGSAVPLTENLEIAGELLELTRAAHVILEIEVGVVGGEEDGVDGESNEKLYTSPRTCRVLDALGAPDGSYMFAATFGNVHGVYKPGNVKLAPRSSRTARTVAAKLGRLEAVSTWSSTADRARPRRRSPRRCTTAW